MTASENRPVELWAQTQDGRPIQHNATKTLSRVEGGVNDGEVDLHVFPEGTDSDAIVTLGYSADEAERVGMDLIRLAGAARG